MATYPSQVQSIAFYRICSMYGLATWFWDTIRVQTITWPRPTINQPVSVNCSLGRAGSSALLFLGVLIAFASKVWIRQLEYLWTKPVCRLAVDLSSCECCGVCLGQNLAIELPYGLNSFKTASPPNSNLNGDKV